MKPSELSAIRVECAEAMGWTRTALPEPLAGGGDTYGYWTSPDGEKSEDGFDPWNGNIHLPDFPEDANAALTLAAKLADDGWTIDIQKREEWAVMIYGKRTDHYEAIAPTFAVALCLAFLAVHRSKKD